MDRFHYTVLDCPLDKAAPWLAGFFSFTSLRLSTKHNLDHLPFLVDHHAKFEKEHREGRHVPFGGLNAINLIYRVMEVTPGDQFCLLESSPPLEADRTPACTLSLYTFSKLYDFRYETCRGVTELMSVSVEQGFRPIRSVVVHQSEDRSRHEFSEYGQPLSWETPERYTEENLQSRLTAELIIEYMHKVFPINYNKLLSRQFSRVFELSDRLDGEGLEDFRKYSEVMENARKEIILGFIGESEVEEMLIRFDHDG